jgi:ACS family D-galactonate transporter-like MFS transporter
LSAERPRGRWTLVTLIATASFINYLDRGSLAVALPVISKDLHLDPIAQGAALSAFFWTYTAMQIPMGRIVDRYSIKAVYAWSFAIWSIAAAATGLATGLWTLIACRILLGIGESVYLPGGLKVVSLHFKSEETAWPAGLFDMGTKIGLAIGTAVDVWLLVRFGWRSLFFRTGLVGLLWLIPWLMFYPSSRGTAPVVAKKIEWGRLLRNRALLGICLGFFCWDYFWYFLISWLPTYLNTVRHMSMPKVALFGGLPFLIFAAAEGIGGWTAGSLMRKGWSLSRVTKGYVAAGFIVGLLIIPAAIVESSTLSIAFLLGSSLAGIGCGSLIAFPKICAREDEVALWTGIMNCAGNVGGVIAPLITGIVVQRTGSYVPAFLTVSVVLVVGVFAYTVIVPSVDAAESPGTPHPATSPR